MIDREEERFNQLTGKYKHYCYEFDGLAIDEDCLEFLYCSCLDIPIKERTLIDDRLRMIEEEIESQLARSLNETITD